MLLFGGSTEGRKIAESLKRTGISACVCVATQYGSDLLNPGNSLDVRVGRLREEEMECLLDELHPKLVVDATHPYATEVSANIKIACANKSCRLIRVVREETLHAKEDGSTAGRADITGICRDCFAEDDFIYRFRTLDEMILRLNTEDGRIFSTLGAKEAEALTSLKNYRERVFLRILPAVEGLQKCIRVGFPKSHIICMQGPYSEALNEAMFRAVCADILITKDSGNAGGFPEKLQAAKKLGMKTAVLLRPTEEEGMVLSDILERIRSGNLR